ncbi:DVU0298 family protein [Raoultibacter phocaeensis]|uniref:DVU0298 family protein n=1 Tax=Raoultibacter phocaeensis TaxID=2479841 RepID=UPI00111806B6|nr:DVU0298 family protein [Raoultibacter phocaeensis]
METITKEAVRALVEAGGEEKLVELFDEDPSRIRRFLTRLCYERDEVCRLRAIECFALLSRERADALPAFFTEIIRRCLWEMNEEGGNVAWSAPEIAGAVIAGSPDRFGAYFSYVACAALDEPTFGPSLIAAYDRVCQAKPSVVQDFEESVRALCERL